jgi:hypothetical protein
VISELTEELTAKDIPWLMETIEECREEGHNKVADMLGEELQGILYRERKQNKKT